MKGDFTINGKSTWSQWGVLMSESGLSNLLSPAPLKPYVTNKSAVANGKIVAAYVPKVDERDITLELFLVASGWNDFNAKLNSFYAELSLGFLEIKTAQSSKYFHVLYQSCSQFTEFDGKMAKFVLTLNEPDPTDTTQRE